MNLSELWKKIGKQPFTVCETTEVKVFIEDAEFYITGIRYENGVLMGLNAVPINCSTCKNNVEYPPSHTCDICTSLDQEEYEMWEEK